MSERTPRERTGRRRGLRGADAKLLATAVVLGLLVGLYALVVSLAEREYSQELPISSIYSEAPEGLQFLYRYLGELGVDSRPLELFEPLPEEGTIVVASDTFLAKEPTQADVQRLAAWVEDGGRVVLAGPVALEAFKGALLAGVSTASADTVTEAPAAPTRYASGVTAASLGPFHLTGVTPDWVAVVGLDEPLIVTRRLGKGEVVVLASPYPLTNDGLGEKDNARLATLLTAGGEQPVYFDEYHQGYARGGSIWDRLSPGGRIGLVFALAAIAIALIARSRRLGPPIVQPEMVAARTSAYIGQLAEVYRRAGARSHALGVLEDALSRSLRRRHGMLTVGLARHPGAVAALEQAERVRSGDTVKTEEFVDAARALVRARRDVEERNG